MAMDSRDAQEEAERSESPRVNGSGIETIISLVRVHLMSLPLLVSRALYLTLSLSFCKQQKTRPDGQSHGICRYSTWQMVL